MNSRVDIADAPLGISSSEPEILFVPIDRRSSPSRGWRATVEGEEFILTFKDRKVAEDYRKIRLAHTNYVIGSAEPEKIEESIRRLASAQGYIVCDFYFDRLVEIYRRYVS